MEDIGAQPKTAPPPADDDDVFEDALDEIAPEKVASKEKKKLRLGRLTKKISGKHASNGGGHHRGHGGDSEAAVLSLGEALEEAKVSVDLFLNNGFDEAKGIVQPMADKSIYHALGYGVFMYLKAVMTFEQKHIEEASQVLSDACDTINRFRKKSGFADSIVGIVKKTDYNSYTDVELHAELCHAECLLLRAALTLCEDETLVSFVKAGLKVRSCYQQFRECWSALNHRSEWQELAYKTDFESGVRMGVGAFNLMISMLPQRVMKLLEFIGFNGNRNAKEAGLKEIMLVYEDKDGLRQFIASFTLLGYHLLLSFFVGSSECDLRLCKKILDEKIETYPDGAFFIFFKGRYHFVQGEMEDAIRWYTKSVDSQDDWPQFHHICYWELYWASMFSRQWWRAAHYSDLLLKDSKWSKCMYAYLRAAAMCMVQGELTDEQREEQIELMRNVPQWKQRIAGKSVPMEKFAVRKAERFLKQGNHLALPALELIYVWNGFKILGQQFRLVEPIFALVEATEKRLLQSKHKVQYYVDDLCLVQLLKAQCLKAMKSPLQAEECLRQVVASGPQLQVDTYLAPYALFELGLLLREDGQKEAAMETFESAKNDYKDYSLQSRLHFRIHAAQTEMKAEKKRAKKEAATASAGGKAVRGSVSSAEDASSESASFHDLSVDDIMPMTAGAASGDATSGRGHAEVKLEDLTEDEARKMMMQGR